MKIAPAAFFALLVLGAPIPAMAGSPGVIEGPAGCTWNATVKKVNKSSMSVHVDEQYGSCVDEACPVDAEGKTYSLPAKKYKTGEVIKIWVDLDKKDKEHATLDIPKCWTQTSMVTVPELDAPAIAPAAGSAKKPPMDYSDLAPVTSNLASHMSDDDMPPIEAFPPPAVSKE